MPATRGMLEAAAHWRNKDVHARVAAGKRAGWVVFLPARRASVVTCLVPECRAHAQPLAPVCARRSGTEERLLSRVSGAGTALVVVGGGRGVGRAVPLPNIVGR
jgi:hypothetical protein